VREEFAEDQVFGGGHRGGVGEGEMERRGDGDGALRDNEKLKR
jgi:hypothetical protein